jgi:chorismate mutase-like protein
MAEETSDQQLARVRRHIDAVDDELIMLLHERAALVAQIGRIKAKYGLAVQQPDRFKELLAHLRAKAKDLDLPEALVDDVWNAIHTHSVAQQKKIV